ncbi:MerR family transcriptional regulator [Nocardioides sp. dk4132]|uniref:MerR family transcriptional regulator n=1 Tax=unclassified Nocardioides TaxID=2615069 RepID=UPI001294CD1D|nr:MULTISPECIES: MerR family transcriptional regulator [unclassified Nocardioides]MQW75979.1 MerR family transcriptional regulator [Nocardioides sp. dk4132]QGA08834.1 MerR family transcriptional regulator [Nocardioides sp. dk884]
MAEEVGREQLLTIDELAAVTGTTVRTTRYYASLGLVPPPVRRGRVAYYGPEHRARLDVVRALQEHGFTLQAIERFLAALPADATVEELALQRAMLTSWTGQPGVEITREELEQRAGRSLDEHDLTMLEKIGSIERGATGYVALPSLRVGVELLDMEVPEDAVEAAGEAIRRHMTALADELTEVLREGVLAPYRREAHSPQDAVRLERTMSRLRQLTLEAVVTGFQRAANAVIARSLKQG